MTTMRVWAAIAFVLAVLLTGVCHAQARSGPTMPTLKGEETATLSSRELQQIDTTEYSLQNADFPGVESKDSEDLQNDDELEIHCHSAELEACDEKRRLTANMDYAHDGPNDPITDPPH